jgi:DNA-binding SARP family transcriptional activator
VLRLEAFGGLALAAGTGSGLTLQRRRLALLALLAVAGDRGISRDRLVAFLWPETESENARHSLEQLLYLVRRQLGEALFIGTDPLRLNSQIIASDLAAFESALSAADDAAAVALYRGPFLDGFYLGDAGEFERWVDGERARLAAAYAAALARLAGLAADRGDLDGAVAFWRKLVAVDTLSARNVLALLRSLVAAGDRPEALRVAATYETLVREELDIPLEPALQAFVTELRAARTAAVESQDATRSRPPPDVAASNVDVGAQPALVVPLSPRQEHDGGATEPPSRIRAPALRRSILVAAIVVLAVGTTWIAPAITSSRAPPVDPGRILVPPFRLTGGDSVLASLHALLPVLFAANLTGEGGPAAIDPRATLSALRRATPADGSEVTEAAMIEVARTLGAGRLFLGEATTVTPGRVELSGRIVSSTGSTGGARASVAGPADSIALLVDRLSGQLLAQLAGEHPQRIASLAARSPAALRSFLEGRAELRRGHAAAAKALFGRALEHDSTFAHAALELALASGNVFRWTTITTDSVRTLALSLGGENAAGSDEDTWDRAIELAWRGREQFPAADRALLLALRVDYPGESFARDVLAGWERAIRAAPDRAEAHFAYGYVLLQQGYAMGLADSRMRAWSSFRRALSLDPAYLSPLTGLIEIAAFERDTVALRRLRTMYLARDSTGGEADYLRWLLAAALQDEPALRGIRSRFDSLDVGTLSRIQRTSQLSGLALEDAERADAAILGQTHEQQQRQVALFRATFLLLNRGRPRDALRLQDLKREVDPVPELGQGFAIRYALMWDGDSAAGARAARALALSMGKAPTPAASNSLTLWRLWHGDTTGAAVAILRSRQAKERGTRGQAGIADVLDALLADLVNRPDTRATLARLDSLARRGCCDQPHFINLVAARLHERAGNLPAALAAIRRGRGFFPAEYLSTYLREEGRLAALTGDTTGAIAAYRHYLILRATAEPSLQPAVAQVRAQLARLEPDRGRRAWWRRLPGFLTR